MTETTAKHPAPYPAAILDKITDSIRYHLQWTPSPPIILDPFAGIGRIHQLAEHGWQTHGIEIEEDWACQAPNGLGTVAGATHHGDACQAPWADSTFDAIATSPVYPNRMTDHHNARDDSRRLTYTHTLGRTLTDGNAGAMPWGDDYRQLHLDAWTEARRLLAPWGILILNIKDHLIRGNRVHVAGWHTETLIRLGFTIIDIDIFATPGLGGAAGEHGRQRTDGELVITLKKAR